MHDSLMLDTLIRPGEILEFCGSPEQDRTFIAIHACNVFQSKYPNSTVIYITSRVSFPDHRFTVSGMTLIGVNDIYGFAAKLTQLELNTIVPQGNTISMVIIDNITWPFRTMERSKFRTRVIRETGRRLKEQAKVKNIPIICINDLTFEYFDDEEKIGKMLIPSLGNTWNEYIDTRIMIVSDKRVMYVAKSKMPFLYQEQYEITETRVNFQRI